MNEARGTLETYKDWIVVVGAMMASALLSFSVLMHKSLRLDEAQSIWQTNHSLYGTLSILAQDIQLPLYYIGLRFWEMMFSTSVESIRSFSLIFLLLSFPAIFVLAKVAYNRGVAYGVVLLALASPFLQWFGSEARMYSLLFLLTCLNHYFFLKLWKTVPTRKDWIFYGLTTILGAYTHYFFVFILMVQAGFYIWHKNLFQRNALRNASIIAGLVILELGAWFILRLYTGTSHAAPQLAPPTSIDLFNLYSNAFIGFQTSSINSFFLSMWPILMLAGLGLLIRRTKAAPHTIYFFFVSFVPVLLAFISSLFIKPMFLSRYLIITLPSLYLLVSYLVSLYGHRARKLVMTGIAVVMFFSLGIEVYSSNIPANENYREAATHIAQHANVNDIVVLTAPFTTYPIEYYYRGVAPITTFPYWQRFEEVKSIPPYSEESLQRQTEEWSKIYKNMYVLMSYDQGYQEATRLYLDKHFERLSATSFSPGLDLYVYKLRYI